MTVDSRTYTIEPDDPREIEEIIELPDDRNYTCTVNPGDAAQVEQKSLTVE